MKLTIYIDAEQSCHGDQAALDGREEEQIVEQQGINAKMGMDILCNRQLQRNALIMTTINDTLKKLELTKWAIP